MYLSWLESIYSFALASCLLSSVRSFSPLQVLSSPSGKLTYAPELVIPDPKDPTAILLLTNAVQTLSERIRIAQSNAAFLDGSIAALQTFCNEQSQAAGNFPGPVPVIYCGKETGDFHAISEAGAKAVLVVVSISQIGETEFMEQCQRAREAGLEPIPEVSETSSDMSVESLVDSLGKAMGQPPKALVLTPKYIVKSDTEEGEQEDEALELADLPTIPKEVSKSIPVLGSVRATAGDGRLSTEASRFKEAGFNGVFLRSDCVPGFRLNPDLEIVSTFWQAVITDLKSTKSKSFGFRSKNNMDVSAATKWGNYQQSVIDSGALGDPEDNYSVMDAAAGDYKGFA